MLLKRVDVVDYGKSRPRQCRVTGEGKRHFAIDIRFGVEHAIDARIVCATCKGILGILQEYHSVGQCGPQRFVGDQTVQDTIGGVEIGLNAVPFAFFDLDTEVDVGNGIGGR